MLLGVEDHPLADYPVLLDGEADVRLERRGLGELAQQLEVLRLRLLVPRSEFLLRLASERPLRLVLGGDAVEVLDHREVALGHECALPPT